MKAKDLFGEPIDENKNPFKTQHKRTVVLTEEQIRAIIRDKTVKYFEQQWEKKYGLPYVLPPRSYGYIQMPIKQAADKGYTYEMLCGGVDRYLSDDFKGYMEQKHPIAFFTKDIPKWVGLGKERVSRQNQVQQEQKQTQVTDEQIRKLNEKYGILRKGDGWLTEDGKYFPKVDDAITWSEKNKPK